MDCFVGASTGALKSISLRDNSFFNVNPIKDLVPKKDGITAMVWSGDQQTELLSAQLDRKLKILDCVNSTQKTLFTIEGGKGAVKGLHLTENDKIVTCVESGAAKIWSRKGEEQTSWNVGEGITTMTGSNSHSLIATGGSNNLIKTWDIETGKQSWAAKNVPQDNLQLEVPIMCTDIRFVPGEHTLIEATKLHEMRLYDPRAQRRPVKKMRFEESPITTISLCYRPNHVIAANSVGEMGLFDLRSKVHPVCKYKGQAGSIRSIDAHPTEPYVATCGIDRFVRVHDVESRKLVHKIYCKAQMNKLLLRKELSILKKAIKKEEDDEDWNEIKHEDDSDIDDEDENDDDSMSGDDSDSDSDVWDELAQPKRRKRAEKDDEAPEPTKKKRVEPSRKRKDVDDEEDEEPKKKTKKAKKNGGVQEKKVEEVKEIEIKEEIISDEEEPVVPQKKRKLSAKPKKKTKNTA